jgi:beta-mannosidase
MTGARVLDLSGTWRAAVLQDDETRLAASVTGFDDADWAELPVPGHWRASPAFADNDDPVTYRVRFSMVPPADGERSFLDLDGVMAASDVWLDGTYLGDTTGYAIPHGFEITHLARASADHVLMIEVGFEPVGTGATRDLSGSFGRSALFGEGHNPGGISRPVLAHTTGPVRIEHSRLRCLDADETSATLLVRVVLDADEARTVTLRTWVDPAGTQARSAGSELVEIEREHPLAAGENRIEYTVPVPSPDLWWPRSLGDQPLYDVGVEVVIDADVSDSCEWRTGLRTVEMVDFITSINGRRLFLKGISLGPTSLHPGDEPAGAIIGDLHVAATAGIDFVRVHGHLAHDDLYAEADRLGLLVWQDLPLQWTMQRSMRSPSRRLARAAVDRLAHHPSVFLWSAHQEPWLGDPRTWRSEGTDARRRHRVRMLSAQFLPSWNRTILDHAVAEILDTSDGTRPVLAHSGVWPHLPQLAGTAAHLWPGWRWGTTADLARLLRWWPRLGRFVAEFGAQAPGDDLELLESSGEWPALDWVAISRETALELPSMRDQVPPGAYADPTEWAVAARAHQAEVVRSHVETLRRLKYRPTGGFAAFALADPVPGITAALHDHDRIPKPAWFAFTEACAPVIVVIDPPPATVHRGQRLRLDVHVVNDRHEPVEDLRAIVTTTVEGGSGTEKRVGWAGEVGADAVSRVGVVTVEVPDDAATTPAAGPVRWLRIETVLTGPDGLRSSRVHRRPITG